MFRIIVMIVILSLTHHMYHQDIPDLNHHHHDMKVSDLIALIKLGPRVKNVVG